MPRTANGIGKGGKSFQDRELAAKVRTLGLEEVYKTLQGKGMGTDKEFRKALLLKVSGTLLPRLNEHTGEGGAPIPIMQIDNAIPGDDSNEKDKGTE